MNRLQLRKCVYCLNDKQFRPRDGSAFSREHVVPEAFALVKQNLTLTDAVCHGCNKHFGEHHDRALGRGTHEALCRFLESQKSAENLDEFSREKVPMRTSESGEPELDCIIVDLVNDGGVAQKVVVGQVCLKSIKTGRWECFRLSEPGALSKTSDAKYDQQNIRVYGAECERAPFLEELKRECKNLRVTDIPPRDAQARSNVVYGELEQRAIAKIAFNYLCKILEKQPQIVRQPEFHDIRNFIRFGSLCSFEAVSVHIDSTDGVRAKRHMVAYHVEDMANGRSIPVAFVSLFNDIVWRVRLSKSIPTGFMNPSSSAHVWDLHNDICARISPTWT